MTITDDQAAITTIIGEAANQPNEGRVAVGIVILNRATLPYASDGTVLGAVEHRWAFSELWAGMTHGQYIALPPSEQGYPELVKLFDQYSAEPIWAEAAKAWADAKAWHAGELMSFIPGPAFKGLTERTVLYLNPKVSTASWAIPANEDAAIFDHVFYHDAA